VGTPFDIVKDSSIWFNTRSLSAARQLDSILYTGTVRSVANDAETGELRYVVEVYYRGDTIPTPCRMMRRFGGAFNYEDVVMQGYDYNSPAGVAAKAGDLVLVGLLGGQGREGVIIGGLTHPARKSIKKDSGPQYKSEFNGVETLINNDGEYTLTFRGQPTNLSVLNSDPSGPVPAAKYDESVGTSFLKWDKTGSFTVSDSAKSDVQKFLIDKKNGTIELNSGKVSLKMDKGAQSMDINCQSYVLTSPSIKLGGPMVLEQAVMGTTYRLQEVTLHTTLVASLMAMGAALTAAGGFLTAAGADPVFAGIAPAAATAVASSAPVIIAAGTQAVAMATAISTFESSAPLYLSNIVKVG
jgi:hypothetical protein